jgi:tetratricopeptide (TPR) repeat protein
LYVAASLCRGDELDPELGAIANLAAHKQWALAAQKILPYRRRHPNSVTAAVLQSEILIRMGLLSDANGVLQRVLLIHPRSIEALSASAELERTLNDKSAAEDLLLRCTRYAPRSAQVWKQLGDLYLSWGKKGAIAAFEHAEALAPNDALVKASIAAAYHQDGHDSLAEREFLRAIRLNDAAAQPDATVNYLYAEFLQDKTRYAESVSQYGRALQRDPNLLDAHFGRAKSLVRLRDWDRAEADLRICVQDENLKIASLNLLTKVAGAEGKADEAQRYADEVAKLSSEDVAQKAANNQIASLLQNAHALMLDKHFSEAAEAYQHLLNDHPAVSEAWLELGRCRAEAGRPDEAEVDIRHFLSLEDSSASGHLLLGRILLRQKQPQSARIEFQRAQAIDPLLTDAWLGIAAACIVEDNFNEAIRELRKFDTLPGIHAEAHLMLTEALYKNHQLEKALREIDRLLKQDPSNQLAQQMKQSLLQARTMQTGH